MMMAAGAILTATATSVESTDIANGNAARPLMYCGEPRAIIASEEEEEEEDAMDSAQTEATERPEDGWQRPTM